MHTSWIPLVLTVCQALLADALPAPPFSQLQKREDPDCPEYGGRGPFDERLTVPFVHTRLTSAPTSSPSDLDTPAPSLFASADFQSGPHASPILNTSPAAASASSSLSGDSSPDPTPGSPRTFGGEFAESQASRYESVIVFGDPHLNLQTVISTDLPSVQSPTFTSAAQSFPDTTGSVMTTLQTDGNPPMQPFPTSLPSVTVSTLQPLTGAPFTLYNATATEPENTLTQTVTLPLTTFETIVVTQTVTTVAVETIATLTATTVLNTTVTANGTTITTSSVGTTVVATTATVLTETTLSASSTITGTIATTVTTNGSLTVLPTSSASCLLSMGCSGQDIFEPVAVDQPPANIEQRSGHPVPRLGINNTTGPIETNKFYANFFLGSQGSPSFVMPYSLTWSQGSGNAQSWGMSISHIADSQRVFGPPDTQIPTAPDSYYINPLGIQSVILSAAELGSSTILTSDSLLAFSANIHLQPSSDSSDSITFPIVQGMGFVTGLYTNLQPAIQSSVFFNDVSSADSPKSGVYKYRLTLADGTTWLLYAIPTNGVSPNFELVSSSLLQGLPNWSGEIQVAKLPANASESIYDDAAGVYPTGGNVAGYAQDSQAQYSLSWNKGGAYASNTPLLMFALPHHIQSFDSATQNKTTTLQLDTTTTGTATAVMADYWVMEEDELPVTMGFAPWRPGNSQNISSLSAAAVTAIQNVSAIEASQNMSAQTNLNSMYYSGKGLSKFATLVYTMHDLADQQSLAAAALVELESAFAVFTNNQQQYPLLYDTDWKGLVSSASYVTGDSGDDFGNSYYNDHHFHYGYFVHAAAVIGYLDPSWLAENKDYVNGLVRDVANPSALDQYFPVFRSFDWYHGHSWAKGLFESGDGKDEESSSEDTMFAYGLKMWGKTIGDASMEARGNLMLSVLARSLQSYFLMESSNVNQPSSFIGNKVSGILFENKVDHTTYFGTDLSYIEGIHMIPVMPFSTLTRTQQFVTEEWDTYFADGAVRQASDIDGGWKGIVYANLANINPTAAYDFFTQPNFNFTWIDGGASLTWYIALSAMLGGEPS